jgi:regulator of nonsense transcripts 2
VFPDLAEPVLEALHREFFGMMKTKNQQYIDGKVKNVRFQAELVKFGLSPPITVFRMLKTLMSEFTPHNVELIGVLLETCGR